jgi:hypothetical protein
VPLFVSLVWVVSRTATASRFDMAYYSSNCSAVLDDRGSTIGECAPTRCCEESLYRRQRWLQIYSPETVTGARSPRVPCRDWCTPGMGVNLWGAPLTLLRAREVPCMPVPHPQHLFSPSIACNRRRFPIKLCIIMRLLFFYFDVSNRKESSRLMNKEISWPLVRLIPRNSDRYPLISSSASKALYSSSVSK